MRRAPSTREPPQPCALGWQPATLCHEPHYHAFPRSSPSHPCAPIHSTGTPQDRDADGSHQGGTSEARASTKRNRRHTQAASHSEGSRSPPRHQQGLTLSAHHGREDAPLPNRETNPHQRTAPDHLAGGLRECSPWRFEGLTERCFSSSRQQRLVISMVP